jgi:Zn-dependent protease with chaperone function
MRKQLAFPFALVALAGVAFAAVNPPKPGWNLFSRQQDVQLGQEASAQVEQKMQVIHNSEVSQYLSELGQRLARSQYAGQWPYRFSLVSDKSVNAFALPGGPMYVNTGLIAAAENEAQLAAVMAHEMSHVALRHGTNQASKQNLIQIPAMIAGGMMGGSGGMLGGLAQLGIGLGANSVLLKFSRSAESQADYNGALIMADAGYNPLEMARFFEKLEAQSGSRSGISAFLSDHPNPGDRGRAIESLVRQLPQQNYTEGNTAEFRQIQALVGNLPTRGELHGPEQAPSVPDIHPSSQLRQYRTNAYSISVPNNWQAFGDQDSPAVTIAPPDALFRGGNGVQVGYGAMVSYYTPQVDRIDLQQHTAELIRHLQQSNGAMSVQSRRNISVDGQNALLTTLSSQSPYRGEREVDALVTVPRPQGLFYMVFIAPRSEWRDAEPVFQWMLQDVHFDR